MFDWNPQRIETLKTRWAEGATAREIAKELNREVGRADAYLTRNGVIGKIHRLNLEPRATPERKPPGTHRPKKKRRSPNPAHKPRKVDPGLAIIRRRHDAVRPEPLNISALDIRDGQCKFAEGEPSDGFCGHPVEVGRPYCPFHAGIAYRPSEPQRRSAA